MHKFSVFRLRTSESMIISLLFFDSSVCEFPNQLRGATVNESRKKNKNRSRTLKCVIKFSHFFDLCCVFFTFRAVVCSGYYSSLY